MLMDRRDRRPILLANARIMDPSRDLDIAGDLLLADGLVREAKRGIGAAGVPEGTEVVECRGHIVAPGLIDMRAGLRDADIVMMLRLQRERMSGSFVPSLQEFSAYFGLDAKKLAYAKPDAMVMHPGPMNRGVEIDSSIADSAQSLIREQVEMGVAVRMAVLEALSRNLPNA